jgi:DNA-directed RNA polymerase specialized sigma24 family protein
MPDSDAFPPAHGDEADLFRELNDELMCSTSTAPSSIRRHRTEDACAHAWMQFLRHRPSRESNWRGWLFRVARREAWRIERKGRDHAGQNLHPLDEIEGAKDSIGAIDEIEIRNDVREALTIISNLRPRLQRVALLRALGHSHAQVGELTGDSPTRVHQLVAMANCEVDEIRAERAHSRRDFPPRAERLWELENDPPDWLVRKIGRPVKPSRKYSGRTEQRRHWRRAALALDDYRRSVGAEGFENMTTESPANPALRESHAAAVKAMSALLALRTAERERSRER